MVGASVLHLRSHLVTAVGGVHPHTLPVMPTRGEGFSPAASAATSGSAGNLPVVNGKPASPLGWSWAQLQPLVLPQLGQAWHEPARCIWTPHCMQ
jgi:hypothetical protein